MPTPTPLTETLIENTTGFYTFTLAQDMSFLESLTLTLYDRDSDIVLHGHEDEDILNANGGTVTTDAGPPPVTTVTYEIQPEDTLFLNPTRRMEYRVLVFTWTWNSGQRRGTHAVQFGVEAVGPA